MVKERIDVLAYRQGLFKTREQSKRGVMAGLVVSFQNGERFDKPGEKIDDGTRLRLKGAGLPYVSRSGLKLAKALQVFDVSVKDKITLDIGSSTGGFTDVMLQHNARLVYAVDVGTNQLSWKLRQDERVVSMEQFNFRYAKKEHFPKTPSFASIDVSFISLNLVLPVLHEILSEFGEAVALIKPQFEVSRDQIRKNGIVRDAVVHESVVEKLIRFSVSIGFSVKQLDFSPIQGRRGNIEFLIFLQKNNHPRMQLSEEISQLVKRAHREFN